MKNNINKSANRVALFFSDIVGYSRMFNSNQELAIKLIDSHNKIAIPNKGMKIIK